MACLIWSLLSYASTFGFFRGSAAVNNPRNFELCRAHFHQKVRSIKLPSSSAPSLTETYKVCELNSLPNSLVRFSTKCCLVHKGLIFSNTSSLPVEMNPINTCAVVSSSATLRNSRCGRQIDTHEAIFRANLAPTDGYERDTGERTTFSVVNSHMARRLARGETTFDSTILEHTCRSPTSIIFTRDEWPGVDQVDRDEVVSDFLNRHCEATENVMNRKAYVLSEDFTGAGENQYEYRNSSTSQFFANILIGNNRSKNKMPSVGFQMALIALFMCKQVSFFGFSGEMTEQVHYFDRNSTWDHHFHDIEVERFVIKAWEASQAVVSYLDS